MLFLCREWRVLSFWTYLLWYYFPAISIWWSVLALFINYSWMHWLLLQCWDYISRLYFLQHKWRIWTVRCHLLRREEKFLPWWNWWMHWLSYWLPHVPKHPPVYHLWAWMGTLWNYLLWYFLGLVSWWRRRMPGLSCPSSWVLDLHDQFGGYYLHLVWCCQSPVYIWY